MICIAPFGSRQQIQSLALRYEVLRLPLGLKFAPAELGRESEQIHILHITASRVTGCLILVPSSTCFKMRQVAVDPDFQNTGIGESLVRFSENVAIERGGKKIELHARDTAVPFYVKLGYDAVGNIFEEVGIPHLKMYKIIA